MRRALLGRLQKDVHTQTRIWVWRRARVRDSGIHVEEGRSFGTWAAGVAAWNEHLRCQCAILGRTLVQGFLWDATGTVSCP